MGHPKLLFGGGDIAKGKFSTPGQVKALLDTLVSSNIAQIDTAALYPLGAPFGSEKVLGDSSMINHGVLADTKILLSPDFTGNGALTRDKIHESVNGSFERLHGKINILYCHSPDSQTPLSETVAALQEQFDAGRFTTLGLSNYSPEQIQELLEVCSEKGNIKPSVFQGQYNALNRGAEKSLLPFLREKGITYVANSPLAGGFLVGKLTSGGDLTGTRFEEGNMDGMFLRASFDKPSMHDAVKRLQAEFQPHGISVTEASLRWLYHHSALKEEDGVILGASSMEQLHENLNALTKGPLDESMVKVFDEVRQMVEADAP